MDPLSIPWMFLGPTGSGKLTKARQWIEQAHNGKITLPMESRNFTVGDDYEARVLASPYHFEIDIPNLSMQDKQIIGELLTKFFSSADVLSSLRTSSRKLVILRRAHSLSLPAAIRVRSIIEQYVLPQDAAGMLWITAREMTGPLALLEDAFVRCRVPRMPHKDWVALDSIPDPLKNEEAWDRCIGRPERVQEILRFFPSGNIPAWPRRIQDYYDEMIEMLIYQATSGKAPNLTVVQWIRGRVYQALSLCQTGPEIIDSCANAIQRKQHMLEPRVFWKAMSVLTIAEPHTSYRTPLSLEAGLLSLFETIRTYTTCICEKPIAITNELALGPATQPSGKSGIKKSTSIVGFTTLDGIHSETASPESKSPNKRRTPNRKKGDDVTVG
jgi:hypothetical protein